MGRVVVVESDPTWADIAVALMAELHSAPPGLLEQFEHIGSTSVPGLAAKPVIDLMASTPSLGAVVPVENDVLSPLGYTRRETGMSGRLFYRREPGTAPARTVAVHLHIVPIDSWADQNERLLRDHLRLHPADADRYGELKRTLARDVDDPLEYTRAKTALIQELVDRARSSRGLPGVNVWPD